MGKNHVKAAQDMMGLNNVDPMGMSNHANAMGANSLGPLAAGPGFGVRGSGFSGNFAAGGQNPYASAGAAFNKADAASAEQLAASNQMGINQQLGLPVGQGMLPDGGQLPGEKLAQQVRDAFGKYAAQDNDKPQQSSTGEDNGVSFKTRDEDHATGTSAWESLGKFMKTADGPADGPLSSAALLKAIAILGGVGGLGGAAVGGLGNSLQGKNVGRGIVTGGLTGAGLGLGAGAGGISGAAGLAAAHNANLVNLDNPNWATVLGGTTMPPALGAGTGAYAGHELAQYLMGDEEEKEGREMHKYAKQPADQLPRHDCHGVHPDQTHEEWVREEFNNPPTRDWEREKESSWWSGAYKTANTYIPQDAIKLLKEAGYAPFQCAFFGGLLNDGIHTDLLPSALEKVAGLVGEEFVTELRAVDIPELLEKVGIVRPLRQLDAAAAAAKATSRGGSGDPLNLSGLVSGRPLSALEASPKIPLRPKAQPPTAANIAVGQGPPNLTSQIDVTAGGAGKIPSDAATQTATTKQFDSGTTPTPAQAEAGINSLKPNIDVVNRNLAGATTADAVADTSKLPPGAATQTSTIGAETGVHPAATTHATTYQPKTTPEAATKTTTIGAETGELSPEATTRVRQVGPDTEGAVIPPAPKATDDPTTITVGGGTGELSPEATTRVQVGSHAEGVVPEGAIPPATKATDAATPEAPKATDAATPEAGVLPPMPEGTPAPTRSRVRDLATGGAGLGLGAGATGVYMSGEIAEQVQKLQGTFKDNPNALVELVGRDSELGKALATISDPETQKLLVAYQEGGIPGVLGTLSPEDKKKAIAAATGGAGGFDLLGMGGLGEGLNEFTKAIGMDSMLDTVMGEGSAANMSPLLKLLMIGGGILGIGGAVSGSKAAGFGGLAAFLLPMVFSKLFGGAGLAQDQPKDDGAAGAGATNAIQIGDPSPPKTQPQVGDPPKPVPLSGPKPTGKPKSTGVKINPNVIPPTPKPKPKPQPVSAAQ
jgi:hypothetical protein